MGTRTVLHLVRHGESAGNVTPGSRRSEDPALTERGRAQAGRAASALAGAGIRAVFTSPLRRARETAEAIAAASGLGVQAVGGLGEVDMGALSDADAEEDRAEREAIFSAWLSGDRRRSFPQGEDFAAVSRRVRRALGEIVRAAPDLRAAVVTHRMAIAAAAELCEPGGAPVVPGACPNGSITTIEVADDGRLRLLAWCDAGHLA